MCKSQARLMIKFYPTLPLHVKGRVGVFLPNCFCHTKCLGLLFLWFRANGLRLKLIEFRVQTYNGEPFLLHHLKLHLFILLLLFIWMLIMHSFIFFTRNDDKQYEIKI
jgi:hypothetical protein